MQQRSCTLLFWTLGLFFFAVSMSHCPCSEEDGQKNCDESNAMRFDWNEPKTFPKFEWKGGPCRHKQFIGRVTVTEAFRLSFDMRVNGPHTEDKWASILHIGATDQERLPGIWFYPKSLQLYVRISDIEDMNRVYDRDIVCSVGETYHLEIESRADGTVSFKLDHKIISVQTDIVIITKFRAPIFAGDPWYDPAPVTISNLVVEPLSTF